jgi:hypothetical protein
MNVFKSPPPKAEVVIVKTEGRLEYDLYLLTATRLGGAKKYGTARIVTDGGTTVPNLHAAAIEYLMAAGETETAEAMAAGKWKADAA